MPKAAAPTLAEFISALQVRERYGGVSDMTVHRWLHDPEMDFPRPYYLGRFRYWKLTELLAWEQAQPRWQALKDEDEPERPTRVRARQAALARHAKARKQGGAARARNQEEAATTHER